MDCHFSLHSRIRTTAEFQQVFLKRQRIAGQFYLLYYLDNSVAHPRLGVIASKRNARKSVTRNKIRRMVKESFRIKKNQLPAMDFVFVAKSQAREASKQELYECTNYLFKQITKRT